MIWPGLAVAMACARFACCTCGDLPARTPADSCHRRAGFRGRDRQTAEEVPASDARPSLSMQQRPAQPENGSGGTAVAMSDRFARADIKVDRLTNTTYLTLVHHPCASLDSSAIIRC